MARFTCRATRAERRRAMAGDVFVPAPLVSFTHAVDVRAAPERIWPWLAQMGAGRGGWYSWDRIDNAGRPSARRIVPELQQVSPGDVMPAAPGATEGFVVARLEPPRDLVLCWPAPDGGVNASWEYTVDEAAPGTARLVARARLAQGALVRARESPAEPAALAARLERLLLSLPRALLLPAARLGHRVMQARALRGIRRWAERRSGGA